MRKKLWFCLLALLGAGWLAMVGNASFAAVIDLPKTGQTKCYDTEGNEIACAATGQDGEYRAGVGWPNPRFTPGVGAESECMLDNLTGLMWPKNLNLPGGKLTWNDALDYTNSLTLCGHSDWRLPNVLEFESIMNKQYAFQGNWLSPFGFFNYYPDEYQTFWTSTTCSKYSSNAYNFSFRWGFGPSWGVKSGAKYTWPVRSGAKGMIALPQTGQVKCYDSTGDEISCPGTGQDGDIKAGVTLPEPRFSDNGNETMTDNLTGLVWAKDVGTSPTESCAGGIKTWQQALDYVHCLNSVEYHGHSDWRLPNFKELLSLNNYQVESNSAWLSSFGFFNIAAGVAYWSSTSAMYRIFGISNGGAFSFHLDPFVNPFWSEKIDLNYVWPVRGGQPGSLIHLDIKANGSDGPIVVSSSTPVSIDISLDPGAYTSEVADWWIAVKTPFAPPEDWYTYVHPVGWQPGINLCAQTGLFGLAPYELLNMTLPVGTYTFYFAVDDPDSIATGPWWGLDSVEVTVGNTTTTTTTTTSTTTTTTTNPTTTTLQL